MAPRRRFRAAGGLLAAACLGHAALGAPLPRLAIEPAGLTVSGVSSGGYMAGQFHVSFSTQVRGVGIFAAGPWFCARGSLARALGDCLDHDSSEPGAAELVALARAAAAAGAVDPLAALAAARVWVFRGTRDETVARPVADALVGFYRAFVPPDRLQYVDTLAAGHGIPTEAAGGRCGTTGPPYLNACHYDGVGIMLGFLYEDATPGAGAPGAPGALRRFDQSPYDPTGTLARDGFVYVPASCAAGHACRLHVAFHGCRQGAEFVGEAFARDAGYERWADSHRLAVLFPQARRSWLWPFNPQGCWDWWGYAGSDYATRTGRQVGAVRAMVRALAGF